MRRAPSLLFQPRGWWSAGWPDWIMGQLLPRALPWKERLTMVDAATMPTPGLLRGSMRARVEMSLLLRARREKMATGS